MIWLIQTCKMARARVEVIEATAGLEATVGVKEGCWWATDLVAIANQRRQEFAGLKDEVAGDDCG